MDVKDITIGSKVYLPIFVPEALFSVGDLHAAMGDGEVGGSGVECGGNIILVVDLVKDIGIPGPLVETDGYWCTIGVGNNLKKAAEIAIDNAIKLIHYKETWGYHEVFMLISCIADLRICQIVNDSVSVRLVVPKGVVPLPIP